MTADSQGADAGLRDLPRKVNSTDITEPIAYNLLVDGFTGGDDHDEQATVATGVVT